LLNPVSQPAEGWVAVTRRVLVVEDNVELSSAICDFLGDAGYEVTPAHDGQQALDRAARLVPDVIVLDRWLPDIDGVDLMHQLNEAGIEPVVILESCLSPPKRHAADAFLAKPFDLDELLDTILRLTGAPTAVPTMEMLF
jgi:DNA-binding response OmpR family regulator